MSLSTFHLTIALVAASQLLTVACAPVVSRRGYTAADVKPGAQCEVAFQYRSTLKPNEARELGRIRVTDSGFSRHCSEPEVREIVRAEACGLGADVVDVQEEKAPSVMATCYHVDARLLALNDASGPRVLPTSSVLESSQDAARKESAAKNDRSFVRNVIIGGVIGGVVAGLVVGLTYGQ